MTCSRPWCSGIRLHPALFATLMQRQILIVFFSPVWITNRIGA